MIKKKIYPDFQELGVSISSVNCAGAHSSSSGCKICSVDPEGGDQPERKIGQI